MKSTHWSRLSLIALAALAVLTGTTVGVVVRCLTLVRLMAVLRDDGESVSQGGPG